MTADDTEAPIKDAYDKNAEYWIRIVRERRDPYQHEITDPALLAAIKNTRGFKFLDAGCGEGSFARLLVERGADHVYGVDSSETLIRAAREHPDARHETSTFYHADVAHLPLSDNIVDVVYANRLPHALAHPERRFHEFARVLRPNGRLIHLSLHPCFYVARDDRNKDFMQGIAARDYFQGRTVVQHFNVDGISPAPSVQRFYSLEEHVRMITAAGFSITNVSEPRPANLLDANDPWRDRFQVPLFLLLEAQLRR
ncbi:class I SAM-dependent methyltransferase [Mycobacteroides abscessus]|uniref:class I SAM-dependent methyltransferase n=1 Tax=Mycobacteroides abscessus TaxID=36809 RepID=UPI000C25F116|nr:class I SAM-dependent methyltransferase [Mycobacteroides abscessus]PVA97605.1 class I SAM-dependent methyltransferase [Mycobacteroides abscessus]QOF34642.1 hypothetical protein E3G57_003558 [Mycobacteroides abscessus]